ncbi:hypothetical protein ACH196_25935 [Mesorhizobium sp. IMUNJ23232]
MFNSILTTVQGYFSRSFWFASFLPVALVAAVHLIVTSLAYPGRFAIKDWVTESLSQTASLTMVAFFGLIVFAYTVSPFTQMVRDLLDGSALPDWLHDLLRMDRETEWRAYAGKLESIKLMRNSFEQMENEKIDAIHTAADSGNALAPPSAGRKDLIDDAVSKLNALSGLWPNVDKAQTAIDSMIEALKKNATDLPDGHAEKANSVALEKAKAELIFKIQAVRLEAEYRFRRLTSRGHRIDLLPTSVGDARRNVERYSEDVYGVDFDYLWTRIQLVMPEREGAFMQGLGDAQSQVNFAALTFVLALSIPLVWLPLLALEGNAPWLFLAIGLLSPPVLYFLYNLVVQSQLVFGEMVRAAIDMYHIDALTKVMRQPKPATLQAERALWEGLKLASQPLNTASVYYEHPKA